jgi:hypothetical protein
LRKIEKIYSEIGKFEKNGKKLQGKIFLNFPIFLVVHLEKKWIAPRSQINTKVGKRFVLLFKIRRKGCGFPIFQTGNPNLLIKLFIKSRSSKTFLFNFKY